MSNYTFANLLEFEVALTELPSGYQKVEYIESSGTQYIDTGIVYQYANAYNIDKIINTSSTSNYYGNQGVLQIDMSIFSSYTGQKIKVSQRNTGNIKCSIYIDDVFKQYGYDMSTHSEGYSYRVFSLGHYGTYSIYKCYYFKCYVNTSLVRTMIPCYRTSDSVAGMYDIVNSVFYTNSGTGTFAVGSDVSSSFVNGDTITITDLSITLTYDGTDWILGTNTTIATLVQASQLCSFAIGSQEGIKIDIPDIGVYIWYDSDWLFIGIYSHQPMELKGLSFETVNVEATHQPLKDNGMSLEIVNVEATHPRLFFKGITLEHLKEVSSGDVLFFAQL